MEAYVLTQHDTRERKRSMRLSIFIHAVILALIFIPFIKTQPVENVKAIIVQFSGGSTAGAKPKAGGAASSPVIEDVVEETEPTPTPPEPTPPVKTLPTPPIVTAENDAPSLPKIEDIKVPEVEEVPEPDPEPEPEVIPDPEPEVVPEKEPEVVPEDTKPQTQKPKQTDRISKIKDALGGLFGGLGKGDGKSDEGDNDNDGNGNGNADSGDGNDDKGDSGNGNGTGEGDGDFDGIGVLSRKVIYRPTRDYPFKDGTVAVNICIDRAGSPVKVGYNRAESTLRDPDLIRAVLNNVSKYRFEPKKNAPRKECGIIKIIIDNDTGFLVPNN